MSHSFNTLDAIQERIEDAIAKNEEKEKVITWMLVIIAIVGLGLLLLGGIRGELGWFVAGGLSEVAIAYPVRSLIKLRKGNSVLLSIVPLLRLMNEKNTQLMVMQIIQKLIQEW